MNKEDKKKKLNEYKKILVDAKNNRIIDDPSLLSEHFNNHLKTNKTRQLIKKDSGFTNIMIPIVITVFIIGFAVGIAFALYKF